LPTSETVAALAGVQELTATNVTSAAVLMVFVMVLAKVHFINPSWAASR
jgi:hypothetical protein